MAVAVAQAGSFSPSLTPGLGTFMCCGCGAKKQKRGGKRQYQSQVGVRVQRNDTALEPRDPRKREEGLTRVVLVASGKTVLARWGRGRFSSSVALSLLGNQCVLPSC